MVWHNYYDGVGSVVGVGEMVVNIYYYYYYYIVLAGLSEWQCKITHSGVGCVGIGGGAGVGGGGGGGGGLSSYSPVPGLRDGVWRRTPTHWTADVRIIKARRVGGDIKGREWNIKGKQVRL